MPKIVPESNFGRDHLNTLLYVESVMVDYAGFEIGLDARMRTRRDNWRWLADRDARHAHGSKREGSVSQNGTLLRDTDIIKHHDDWDCLSDMAVAGYFDRDTPWQVGDVLRLSDRGAAVAYAFRRHKIHGGTYANFVAPLVPVIDPQAEMAPMKSGIREALEHLERADRVHPDSAEHFCEISDAQKVLRALLTVSDEHNVNESRRDELGAQRGS